MKKLRYTLEQITFALRLARNGTPVLKVCGQSQRESDLSRGGQGFIVAVPFSLTACTNLDCANEFLVNLGYFATEIF